MAESVRGRAQAPSLQAAADGNDGDRASPAQRDAELRRMAAFRVRETANRIATLSNSAQNETLRRDLMALCRTLLREERALLDLPEPAADD